MTEKKFEKFGETPEPPIENIIERVDERLKALGISDRQASIRATGYPDAVRELRRFKRPSDKRIRQLAKALETHPDYLAGYVDSPNAGLWKTTTESAMPLEGVQPLPRDIPVYGATIGEEMGKLAMEGAFHFMASGYDFDEPIDFARRPPRLAHRNDIYAVMVHDTAMFPRFRVADVLYVDPRRYPAPGEDAFLRFRPEAIPKLATTGAWGLICAVRDEGVTHPGIKTWPLETFKPPISFDIRTDQVTNVHRIIPWGELLSL